MPYDSADPPTPEGIVFAVGRGLAHKSVDEGISYHEEPRAGPSQKLDTLQKLAIQEPLVRLSNNKKTHI